MDRDRRIFECSAAESDVLAAIKRWPGVPAIVTFKSDDDGTVATAPEDVERHGQNAGIFDPSVIDAEYRRLRYTKGWTFMMCPEERLATAKIAIIGLNPGGGGSQDDSVYHGSWDVAEGNAYFRPWDEDRRCAPMQLQVQHWHEIAGVGPDETFCAQFVPFRSPDWRKLGNLDEALAFARRLWRWGIERSPATTFIVMGKIAGNEISGLLDCESVGSFPTGWGTTKIGLSKSASGTRVITMPHPSRYLLFGRGAASAVAAIGLRRALTE